MKIGIILGTADPEIVYNTFRFGVLALRGGHDVRIFLINHGVNIEDIESPVFNVREQVFLYTKKQGELLACMKSMKTHNRTESEVCRPGSLDDLLALVTGSDRVLSFG